MKKNIALLFMILLFVATTISTIYLFSKNIEKTKEIEALNQKMEENKKEYDESLASKEKEEKLLLPVFDENKVINKTDDMSINLAANTKLGIQVRLDESGKVKVRIIDAMYIKDFKGSTNEENEVEGISGKVIDVNVYNQGNGINPQIIMLLEDGTVEYVNMNELKNGNYITAGKVSGVENIIKIIEVSIVTAEGSEKINIAGIKSDGTSILFPELKTEIES